MTTGYPGRVSRKDQGEIKIPKKIAIKTSRIYDLSKKQYSFLFTFKPSFLYILSQYLLANLNEFYFVSRVGINSERQNEEKVVFFGLEF